MKTVGLLALLAGVAAVLIGQPLQSEADSPILTGLVNAVFDILLAAGQILLSFGPDLFDVIHNSPYCPVELLRSIVLGLLYAIGQGDAFEVVNVVQTVPNVVRHGHGLDPPTHPTGWVGLGRTFQCSWWIELGWVRI